jgi:predicted methyltransferase
MKIMLDTIIKRVQLKEGIKAIEQYVFLLLCYPHSSVQFLSHQLSIPIPIVSAIKKELKKENVVETNHGISLSVYGEKVIRQELHLEYFDVNKYITVLNETKYQWFLEQYPMLEEVYEQRPIADVTIDQSKCTLETAYKRAMFLLQKHTLLNRTIVCIGDDDLVSVACCFLHQYLFNHQTSSLQVTVIDSDPRILKYIHDLATTYKLPLQTLQHNLLQPIHSSLLQYFDVAVSDPPYTKEGYMLFVSRGLSCLKKEDNLLFLVSYPRRPIEDRLVMQKFFTDSGVVIESIEEKFNQYEGAQILGGVSDLYVLKTTKETKPTILDVYQKEIYTHKNNRTIRHYQCMSCKKIYVIGQKQKIKTIEQLKQHLCQYCQGTKFKLLRREQEEKTRCNL